MGRFLIYFSYLGTRYSGVQIQNKSFAQGKPIQTVEGALKAAMQKLKPANDFRIVLSSRTDKGVHALKNACHVDLVNPHEGKEFNPDVITSVLNFYLKKTEHEVRVLETKQVANTFHSRLHSIGRKYVYRLGHTIKPLSVLEAEESRTLFITDLRKYCSKKNMRASPWGDMLSSLDAYRVSVVRFKLDIDKLILAAEMISGIHDYTSFTVRRKLNADYLPHPVKMLTVGVKRGQPFGHQLQRLSHDVTERVEFWDIHVQARSFLYKQVRRAVGAMVLLARGVISVEELQNILDNPLKVFNFSSLMGMGGDGLYLADVKYRPKDLEFNAVEEAGSVFVSHTSAADEVNERTVDDVDDDDDNKIVDDTEDSMDSSSDEDPSLQFEDETVHLGNKKAEPLEGR